MRWAILAAVILARCSFSLAFAVIIAHFAHVSWLVGLLVVHCVDAELRFCVKQTGEK